MPVSGGAPGAPAGTDPWEDPYVIVVAGEALIDLVPDRPGPWAPLHPRPGGGPYNTALALGRLGSRTAFLSRLSEDGYGTALLAGLSGAGVDVSGVQRGPEPTTLALASVAPDGGAGYAFYGEGTADRLFTAADRLPAGTRAVSFGTCSLVLEPGASAYERVLHRAHRDGVLTVLDPNVRPALIPDAEAHRARFRSWLPSVDLLKLSVEDARWLGGAPTDWLAAGPAAVVLTRGADGLSVHTRAGEEVRVPAVRVRVVDTIGAGDTVTAALLHRLAAHDALGAGALAAFPRSGWTDVLGFAARAAALTCTRRGADAPTAAEVSAPSRLLTSGRWLLGRVVEYPARPRTGES
ncbi:carbohydrate kinase, partial [Streptomyces sp. NPDC049906]|uniref:carbohydrate kinase family protein n=1 Tax=Streptomyces sp. NPDC049906 TaxID=3155656 RepID=UPI00344193C0